MERSFSTLKKSLFNHRSGLASASVKVSETSQTFWELSGTATYRPTGYSPPPKGEPLSELRVAFLPRRSDRTVLPALSLNSRRVAALVLLSLSGETSSRRLY